MNELVMIHHNEPMTTSMAIAEGTENTHAAVIKLVRKYVEDLQTFGPLGFEIQVARPGRGGEATEYAYLNEPQATLLITYLRNTEIVRRFKIALVKAFYEMRDRLAAPAEFTTRQLDHGADLAVAADRTFRGFLRSARSAGMRMPAALKVANAQTVARTGMDMLAELVMDADEPEVSGSLPPIPPPPDPIAEAVKLWVPRAGDDWYTMEQILLEALDVKPGARDHMRLSILVARTLTAMGFIHRKLRLDGQGPRARWRKREPE